MNREVPSNGGGRGEDLPVDKDDFHSSFIRSSCPHIIVAKESPFLRDFASGKLNSLAAICQFVQFSFSTRECLTFQETVLNNPGQEKYWPSAVISRVPRDRIRAKYDGASVSVTIVISGMRRFSGSFSPEFVPNGQCCMYVKNKARNQFTVLNGVLDGKYCEYNDHGEKMKTIIFQDGKVKSVMNSGKKCLKDERKNGSGLFGECLDSSSMSWNGLVFYFDHNRVTMVYMYECGELAFKCGSFEERDGVSLYIQYTQDKRVQYCGEYLFDEKEGEVYYHGYGILFGEDNGRFGCIYKGSFNRGRFSGFGSSYDLKSGLKKEEGIWKDGELRNGDSFVGGMLKNNVVSEVEHFNALGANPGKVVIEKESSRLKVTDVVFEKGPIVQARMIVCSKDALSGVKSFKIVGYPNLEELVVDECCLTECTRVTIEDCPSLKSIQIKNNTLPKVKRLDLINLPALSTLSFGTGSLNSCSEISCSRIPSTLALSVSPQSLDHLATVFAPSTVPRELLNKLVSCSRSNPFIQSTTYDVSDLARVDQASCISLTLKEHSANDSEALFGNFPYLEDLVISDHCCQRASSLLLDANTHLRSLRIGSDCFTNTSEGLNGSVVIKGLPVLESVVIGRNSFTAFKELRVENCAKLLSVTIGQCQDCKSAVLGKEDKCYSFAKASQCVIRSGAGWRGSGVDNAALQTVSVGHACFLAPVTLRLESLPALRTVECGAMAFCHCELLSIANSSLDTLVLHPFAFYHCKKFAVKDVGSEVALRLIGPIEHFRGLDNTLEIKNMSLKRTVKQITMLKWGVC